MRKTRQVVISVLAAGLTMGVLQAPAQAATKAGDDCKRIGQSKSVKSTKGKLLCLRVAGQRTWVFVPKSSSKARAEKMAKGWQRQAELPNESALRYFAASSDAYVTERLTLAQQGRDELAQRAAALSSQQAALQSELTNLPSQVSAASVAAQTAESKLEEPLQAAQSASSSASLLASEYARLEGEMGAHIGCRVLEDFGFYPPGSCGYFDQSYYNSVRSRYNAAQARADSLWANYRSAYNDYKAKYDEYKRLYDRQAAAQNELNETGAELANVNGALAAAEAHLAASHDTNGQLQDLKVTLARWDSTNTKLRQLASKKLRGNWESQFERMARLAGIAQLHRKNLLDTFIVFRGLTADLPDPPVSTPPEEQAETEAEDPSSSEPTSDVASTG